MSIDVIEDIQSVKSKQEFITEKSIDQMTQDEKWVNLHSMFVDLSLRKKSLPDAFKDDPQGFMERKHAYEMKLKDEQRSIDLDFPDDPEEAEQVENFKNYNHYLRALRALRRFQAPQIEKAKASHDQEGSLQETYLEATIGYNAQIGERVLIQLNSNNSLWGENEEQKKYIINPHLIENAAENEETFHKAVKEVLKASPDLIYNKVYILQYVLTKEEIRDALFNAHSSYKYLETFKVYGAFLSTEDKRLLFEKAQNVEGIHNQEINIINFCFDKNNSEVFDEHQKALLVNQALIDMRIIYAVDYFKTLKDKGLITQDVIKTIIQNKIHQFKNLEDFDSIFAFYTDEEKPLLIQSIVDWYKQEAKISDLESLSETMDIFSLEQRESFIEEVVLRDKFRTDLFSGNIRWFETNISTEKFHFILQRLLDDPDFPVSNTGVRVIGNAKCLDFEEKRDFFDSLVDKQQTDSIYNWLRDVNISDEQYAIVSHLIDRLGINNFVRQAGTHWTTLFDLVSLKSFISKSENDHKSFEEWLYGVKYWGARFDEDPEFVNDILKRHRLSHTGNLIDTLPDIISYIPTSEQEMFIKSLIETNPFAAIVQLDFNSSYFSDIGVAITRDEIIADAKKHEVQHLVPKVFRRLFQQFSETKASGEQAAVMNEGYNLYMMIARIKDNGYLDEFERFLSAGTNSEKEEKEVLQTVFAFSILKSIDENAFSLDTLGESINEAKYLLFQKMATILALDTNITPEQTQRFFDQMENPSNFLIYLTQYKDSLPHKKILQDIFKSLLEGEFSQWKFGENSIESFETFRDAKLLPEQLTFDQYQKWKLDEQTTLYESLETDSQFAAQSVRDYLQNNLQHLEISDIIDSLEQKYHHTNKFESVKLELAQTGMKLGEVNKQIGTIKKLQLDHSDELDSLLQTKNLLEKERSELVRAKKMFQLLTLKPEEIASGYILEGKDKGKTVPIRRILGELRQSADNVNQFVYDSVLQMINNFSSQTGETQNLVCIDSSDPKIWLEIGDNPVSSCQSYNYGEYNECLVGYTEPNTKIIILRNERGNLIGRSICKLLTDKQGQPALHLETIYASTTSPGVKKSIFTRAFQKATDMGVKLYVSSQSQNENGEIQPTEVAKGFALKSVDTTLTSAASRAPDIYLDSQAGPVKGGKYTLGKLSEVVST